MSSIVWTPAMSQAAKHDRQAIDVSVFIPPSATDEVTVQIERVTITGRNVLVEYSVNYEKFYRGPSGYGACASARVPVSWNVDPTKLSITKKNITVLDGNDTVTLISGTFFIISISFFLYSTIYN